MTVTNFQLSLSGAQWIDVNTQVTVNNLPDRVPNHLAITIASLFNLFNCPIGARGKIFQPEYGSEWYYFLQQPIDEQTAKEMRIAMIQAIARWEPRITLDYANTYIQVRYDLPGYFVKISGIDTLSKDPISVQFTEILGN